MVTSDFGNSYSRNAYAPIFDEYRTVNLERVKYLMSQDITFLSDADYNELIKAFEALAEQKGDKGIHGMEDFIKAAYPNPLCTEISDIERDNPYLMKYQISPVFVEMTERYCVRLQQEINKRIVFSTLSELPDDLRKKLSQSGILKGICKNFAELYQIDKDVQAPVDIKIVKTVDGRNEFNYTVTLYSLDLNGNWAEQRSDDGKTFKVYDVSYDAAILLRNATTANIESLQKDLKQEIMQYAITNVSSEIYDKTLGEAIEAIDPYGIVDSAKFMYEYLTGLGKLVQEVQANNKFVGENAGNLKIADLMDKLHINSQITENVDGSLSFNYSTFDIKGLQFDMFVSGNLELAIVCDSVNGIRESLSKDAVEDYYNWYSTDYSEREVGDMKENLKDALTRAQESGKLPQYNGIKSIQELRPNDWDVLHKYWKENIE